MEILFNICCGFWTLFIIGNGLRGFDNSLHGIREEPIRMSNFEKESLLEISMVTIISWFFSYGVDLFFGGI